MKESMKELIAIGASVGAHCQPCLEYHIQTAIELGVRSDEIRQAIEIGHKVEKGAMAAMKKFSEKAWTDLGSATLPEEGTANKPAEDPPDGRAKILRIYDPAMCCSSGVCGPSVDPVLARFAGTVQFVAQQPGVKIERYNLSQQPQAFVANPQVKILLADGGEKRLPFIFIDDQLLCQGLYPSKEELLQALGIINPITPLFPNTAVPATGPCCGEGGCC